MSTRNNVTLSPFGKTGSRFTVSLNGKGIGFLIRSGAVWKFEYRADGSITKADTPELAIARKLARLEMSKQPERSGQNNNCPGGLHNGGYYMEIWEVVGVDTTAQIKFNDGRTVQGVRWMLVGDAPQDLKNPTRYLGRVVKDQFVSNERLQSLGVAPKPGDVVTMYFNRFGDIAKVEIAA